MIDSRKNNKSDSMFLKKKLAKKMKEKRKELLDKKDRYTFPYHNCPKCGFENIKLIQKYREKEFHEYLLNKSKTTNLNPITKKFPRTIPMVLECSDCSYKLSSDDYNENILSELERKICIELGKMAVKTSRHK